MSHRSFHEACVPVSVLRRGRRGCRNVGPRSCRSRRAPPQCPTFNKDVLPVLQKQCQECHRPNSIAPMSFMTYKDTRPYARAIEKAVVGRTMPPWFADPTVGHFKNTKLLTDAEIETHQRVGE